MHYNLFTGKTFNFQVTNKFDRLLRCAHYSAVRCASRQLAGSALSGIVLKTSIGLLRYSDVLLADRAYYEAGNEARKAELSSVAFVFLNHVLDLEECIEEGDGSVLGKRHFLVNKNKEKSNLYE